jgi:hypothetical protein
LRRDDSPETYDEDQAGFDPETLPAFLQKDQPHEGRHIEGEDQGH